MWLMNATSRWWSSYQREQNPDTLAQKLREDDQRRRDWDKRRAEWEKRALQQWSEPR